MRLPSLTLSILSSFILVLPSLGASPQSPGSALTSPLHVPQCLEHPGGYERLICARLLLALKNLDYYGQRKVWSRFVTGDGHLPAVFSFEDAQRRSCYLSMDLYEPGVPKSAKEIFSLEQEQTDFNNIYHECIKSYGAGGYNRLGLFGNVAAQLGPPLKPGEPWLDDNRTVGTWLAGTDASFIRTIDLTHLAPFGDS
ncbi:MAG: hypothetical protein LQ348_000066 [Seirophora lacunosa]|nr:MAG: hypothetical protein LQ344_000535 [Seirophora lacunosa]KAI4208745.1 MAG: hypothetical protein LQ348_000066 [Seirophora lacunosa]